MSNIIDCLTELPCASARAVAFQVHCDELKPEGFQVPGDAVAPGGVEKGWKFVAIHLDACDAVMVADAHLPEPFFLQHSLSLLYTF